MRHAVAAGIFQPQQVVTITVSLQQITELEARRWQQDEISYAGKMYDVIPNGGRQATWLCNAFVMKTKII